MFFQASNLIGLSVGSLKEQTKIGKVTGLIIDPENGHVLALEVKVGVFFSKPKFLVVSDILDFDEHGVVTKTLENLVEANEIVRVKKVLEQKIRLIGSNAVTSNKKSLGKIYDLLLEDETFYVVKYYIRGLFQDRIISQQKVLKIEKNKVIFADDVIVETSMPQAEEAAA